MSELNEETGGVDRIDCGQFDDMAAELALGVLTGRERAAALAHIEECPACREYVRELTTTGEELLGLLPPREPPPGFESRVLERLGLPVPDAGPEGQGTQARGARRPGAPAPGTGAKVLRPRRASSPGPAGRRRGMRPASARVLTAAAIVLAVVAGGLGGWGVRSATTPGSSPVSAASSLKSAALLTAAHQSAGEVFLYTHGPHWMFANVDLNSSQTTTVRCQLKTADGKVWTIGSFRLTNGYGAWGGSWTAGAAPVTGARLITPDGTVLASATFS